MAFKPILLVFIISLLVVVECTVTYYEVLISDQSAKEGDDEVVIICDYSQITSSPNTINWNEVDEDGMTINHGIVNERKTVNGRYSLRLTPGKAGLVISDPVRNDSQRRYQCRIRNKIGKVQSSDSSLLTVYYLDDPVLKASADIAYEGDQVTLACIMPDGDPTPYIEWYKDGNAVISEDIVTNRIMSVLYIRDSTLDADGVYICTAENDRFKGEDGKRSDEHRLTVLYYIRVTFTMEPGVMICNAVGHPEPSLVTIYGENFDKGTNKAAVRIEENCASTFMCYAENGELNTTESIIIPCNGLDDRLGIPIAVFIITVFVALTLGVIPTSLIGRYLYKRKTRKIRLDYQSQKNHNKPDESLAIYTDINEPEVVGTLNDYETHVY